MALVDRGIWQVNFTFQDNNDKTATVGVAFPGATIFADLLNDVAALATDLAAISDAALVSYTMTRIFNEDTDPTPPASSEVERKLLIPLNAGAYRNASSMEVPSPVFTIEQDGTDVPLASSAALLALIDQLTQGRLAPGNGIVTAYGLDITSAGTPTVVHRNRAARK